MPHIEVKNVYKIFGPDPLKMLKRVKEGADKSELLEETEHTIGLSNIDLTIEKGEIFVIMGLSGSGKSTLIRHFNRLIEPTSGCILFDGTDITTMSTKQLNAFRQNYVSMVFQRFGLMPHRVVIDNVAFGLEICKMPRAQRHEKAMEWIETVGLQGYENVYPAELSGGMQQRVGLARALCTNPQVLLMDEAFSSLDPLIRSAMQDQLLLLQEKLGTTIVFITHDLEEALRIGQRIAILKDGSISQIGKPSEILLNPVDDYVREFVRGVNRARVLQVKRIMRPIPTQLSDETVEVAVQRIRQSDSEYGYVVIDGQYQGIVSLNELELISNKQLQQDKIVCYAQKEPYTLLHANMTVECAVAQALRHNHPLPVIDEKQGKLCGVVHHKDVAHIFDI